MKITRNTVQRNMVLAAVNELRCHPTAEDIYQAVRARHPSVSKGTVYRNLHLLAQREEIRQVALPDGADRFDFRTAPHCHIRCEGCGRVFDAELESLDSIGRQARFPQGFVLRGCDIVFRGICPDCNKKNKNMEE